MKMNEEMIKKLWRCSKCEKPLPRKGGLWTFRFKYWLKEFDEAKKDLTIYYCPACIFIKNEG